ncbi:LysR family transcriptional regulator [Hansschlegelia zhihuaiae]|uniref:LysR family transcriptional regulator n=1 Tax=Hansschlegelia zhihuaiae TaxID=405005 RepID=A0A4Q0MN25_9HYPH|nr:LysR family transcriptional regulator [Hansschlegelia zhihuaiae]RXF74436.1 LysR family transcriptional regulator [Hansschlegelia zhihuaiae]
MLAWDDFRLVKAIAERRSLAGAADILGVNASTVFRRLGALEDRLGARLFERGRAGYGLTTAGDEMAAIADRMSDDIVSFERRVLGQDLAPTGELRVTTNDSLLIHALTDVFAGFRRAYPDITLDVVVGNAVLNLSKRDADIALRVTSAPPETLVGRRLASIYWAVYGLAPLRAVDSVEALDHLPWIGPGDMLGHLQRWLRDQVGEHKMVYRLNTVLGMAEAIAAGIGVGPLPCYIASRFPGLVRLYDPPGQQPPGLWILTHPDLRSSARIRAFMDHVGQELARRRPCFEGVREREPA